MVERGSRQVNAVLFIVLISLVAGAVIVHASLQRREDKPVHLGTPSPAETASPSVSGSTSDSSPSPAPIPTPGAIDLEVGLALCQAGVDYTTSVTRLATADEVDYDVAAKHRGKTSCIFADYPVVTVLPDKPGSRRTLRPFGTVIDGYGNPPQTSLKGNATVHSYLRVAGTCEHARPLRDVRFDGTKLVTAITAWCQILEEPWGLRANAGTTGPIPCKPYNIEISGFKITHPRGGPRYTLTLRNKSASRCSFLTYARLTTTISGIPHLLDTKLGVPLGPALLLIPEATATMSFQVVGSCPKRHLIKVTVEGVPVAIDRKVPPTILSIPTWCSIKESYWVP